ncbi:hypothetical protein [Mitsuokella sp. oral taxon 131]|uniref:hypothetical protein n=1 Tax=Mitsuokella sp. oral taxon 131 TaxID=1321780 RepID=UPI0003F57739|nr:hypothetical protein [Mitsuokella sp. oral taxon 131]
MGLSSSNSEKKKETVYYSPSEVLNAVYDNAHANNDMIGVMFDDIKMLLEQNKELLKQNQEMMSRIERLESHSERLPSERKLSQTQRLAMF